MPNSVVVLSTTVPPTERPVSSWYRLGLSVDQSAGLVTFVVMVALCDCPAGTLTLHGPAFRQAPRRRRRNTRCRRKRPRISISPDPPADRKSTRLNSSHLGISYAVFC